MCCETPKGVDAHDPSPGLACGDPAAFYRDLRFAMHAIAQPITILQAQVYLARNSGALDAQLLLNDAAASVDHLCRTFRLLQELVQVQGLPAKISSMPFARLLAGFSDDAEAIFAGSGLQLHLDADEVEIGLPGGCAQPLPGLMIGVDFKRIRQALASLLHIARETSQSKTGVSCRWAIEERRVALSIRPELPVFKASPDNLSEESRLHLALARACLRGQPLTFRLTEEPFALLLWLPYADAMAAPC